MGYKLNMAALNNVHVAVEDTLKGTGQYKGNRLPIQPFQGSTCAVFLLASVFAVETWGLFL